MHLLLLTFSHILKNGGKFKYDPAESIRRENSNHKKSRSNIFKATHEFILGDIEKKLDRKMAEKPLIQLASAKNRFSSLSWVPFFMTSDLLHSAARVSFFLFCAITEFYFRTLFFTIQTFFSIFHSSAS